MTVASEPQTPRPSIFSPTDRAKWDAWKSKGQEWKGKEAEAEARYIDIARSLGWTPEIEASPPTEQKKRVKDSEASAEELLERDSDDEEGGSGGGVGGMGNYVSTLQKAGDEEGDDQTENSLHGLSVNGDVKKLQVLLESNSTTINVNELDEYVSYDFVFLLECQKFVIIPQLSFCQSYRALPLSTLLAIGGMRM